MSHRSSTPELSTLFKLCQEGKVRDALVATKLHCTHHGCCIPTAYLLYLLRCCTKKKDSGSCRELHSLLLNHGLLADDSFWSDHLIRSFAHCGDLTQANEVFQNVKNPSIYTWNAIVSANSKLGNTDYAMELYFAMQNRGFKPDKYTLLGTLSACISAGSFKEGRLIHENVIEFGIECDIVIGNTLINMYMKCGILDDGHRLFDNLPKRDVITWDVIISGYVQNGDGYSAMYLFQRMQKEDSIAPDIFLLSSVLKACGVMGDLRRGMVIHHWVIQNRHRSDFVLVNALIDMYLKCGSIIEGNKVFHDSSKKDVVTWNAIIAGHIQHGNAFHAIKLFKEMRAGVLKPNEVTYSCMFKACGSIRDLVLGISLHEEMQRTGIDLDLVVKNALIDMYSKCGGSKECLEVFNELPVKDIISWNAALAGFAEHENNYLALELFERMRKEGVEPDKVTFSTILKVCGMIGALQKGRLIHELMIKVALGFDGVVCISLIDMYAKCESFDDAHNLLKQPLFHNVESWNALISGYSCHGNLMAVNCYIKEMLKQGLKPNRRTYSSVLAACSHIGMVEQGCQHFEAMIRIHGIMPVFEHLNCIVDLFSRVGQLEEAERFLQTMPLDQSLTGWRALLTSCKVHGNLELGKDCHDQALELC